MVSKAVIFTAFSLFCVQVNAEWNSYKVIQSFVSEWMNKTLMTAELKTEVGNDMYTGYLSNIHMEERQIQDFAFRFLRQRNGEFMMNVGASGDQVIIARGVIDQLTHSKSNSESSAGLCPEKDIFHNASCVEWEGFSLDEARNIYNRSVSTESRFALEIPTRILTTDTISHQLGEIRLNSLIKKVSSTPAPVPLLDFDPIVYYLNDNSWKNELVNENFCEDLKKQAWEIGEDAVVDMSKAPKNHALEKFSLMKKNVRHAPTTNNILKKCYQTLKATLPASNMETRKARMNVATSAMVQTGTLESLNLLSYLIEMEPEMILPSDVSSMPDDVPKAMLGPIYLRQFYKLVIKSLNSDRLSENVKTAFVISFSCVLRRALSEENTRLESQPSPGDILEYVRFLDVTETDFRHFKSGREHVFIRALANIPLHTSVETLSQLFDRYDNLDMKLFIVNSMDKFAIDLPEHAATTLSKMYEFDEDVIKAAAFIQLMKTGLLTAEKIQQIVQYPKSKDFKATFAQVMASCLSNLYGAKMTIECKNTDFTITDERANKLAEIIPDSVFETPFDSNRNVGYLTLRSVNQSQVAERYTISFTVLENVKCLIIGDTGYAQFMFDCSGTSPDDINSHLLFTSSLQSVSYPTKLSGFKYYWSTITPSLGGFKLRPNVNGMELSAIFSVRNQTQHGIIDMINSREYIIGLDNNIQLFVPKLQIQMKPTGFRVDIVDENFVVSQQDSRLVHMSSWPYSVARDYFHSTPTGQDVNTIQRLRQPVVETSVDLADSKWNMFPTGLAFDLKSKSEHHSDEDSDEHHQIYNFWLNATKTTTKYIEMNVDMGREYTNMYLLKTTRGNAFSNAGLSRMSFRNWGMCINAEASLLFHGPPNIEYKAKASYGSTSSGALVMSIVAKLETDQEQKYQICGDLGMKGNNNDFELYGDLEYGVQCRTTNSTMNLQMVDNINNLSENHDFSKAVINHENTTPFMTEALCAVTTLNVTFVPPLQCPQELEV